VVNLQSELKQSRPFKNLAEEAYLSIQRTAAVLEHQLETALKPSGVTATQYNVLRILRGAGDQGLCRHEIGERLIRNVSDVTRLLDRLEDSHLITRARGGEDRRYVTTRISAAGLRLLEQLDSRIDAIHRTQFDHVDAEGLRSLVDLLATVRNVR
jgi:DNA-binding MarR family transcriptional regulator